MISYHYKIKKSILFKIYLIFILFLLFLFSASAVQAQRIITDMMGRKIELPAEINRIVTSYKPATQFVLALGAEDKLVGVSMQTDQEKLFVSLKKELAELPQIGSRRNGINLESTLNLRPDLVILYPHSDALETAAKLEEHNTAAFIINPESLAKIKESTELLAKALNKEEKAAEVLKAYQKIENLTDLSSNLKEEAKKHIYFANSEMSSSVGAEMLQTNLIEKAGAVNPAAEIKKGFITVSAENILSWNPDLIIVSQNFNQNLNSLKEDIRFQNIKAFKEDNIFRFPSNLEPWDFPSPSSFIAQLWLAVKAYPELYSDLDYKEEVNQFYYSLYRKTFVELGGEF